MAEPKRDRWGRYILTDPTTGDEKPWTRATTLAGALDDTFGLEKWKLRTVILGLVSRDDLLDLAYACDPDDTEQLNGLADDALKAAKIDEKSNRGTALHKFTARLDAGELARSPRQWKDHLDSYVAFKGEQAIQTTPVFIERITVVPSLEVAGTMDRIVKHRGEPKIADLKTGKVEHGGMKMAIQLAIYAHGEGLWNQETGQWGPMPDGLSMDRGSHYPLARTERDDDGNRVPPSLYTVDLEVGWRMAHAAYLVRQWRKNKEFLTKIEAA